MTGILQRAAERVQDSMDEILANFKPGAKITVLVRTPGKPSADFCMTDDDLDEVIAMIRRRKGDASPQPNKPVAWATIPKVIGGLRWTTDIKAQAERWESDGHVLAPLYEHPPQTREAPLSPSKVREE